MALAQPEIHANDLLLGSWQLSDRRAAVAAYADPTIQRWYCSAYRGWLREWSEVRQRSASDIAADLALTPEAVRRNLIRFGIPRRPARLRHHCRMVRQVYGSKLVTDTTGLQPVSRVQQRLQHAPRQPPRRRSMLSRPEDAVSDAILRRTQRRDRENRSCRP
ncbi:hypothetical protein [Micromonospora sediminimaris]|uniref:hypothetical protein n=1 Tax=Micromonospora sediminimaris TaxID=547162 RepID=UPI001113FF27